MFILEVWGERENKSDAPEFERVAVGSSAWMRNSCWPHRPAKKSHFSALKAFSKKNTVHHLWERKNRNSCDMALRVARDARESLANSRGDKTRYAGHGQVLSRLSQSDQREYE